MSDGRRVQRVADAIRLNLAGTLLRELGDPLLQSLVVTSVHVTPDLRSARIGVRLLADDHDEARRRAALRALGRAGGRIRRALAPKLGLRYFPELVFSYDAGHDAERRVEELLDEIARERPPADDADPALADEDPAPADEDPAPADEDPAPADEDPAPADHDPAD